MLNKLVLMKAIEDRDNGMMPNFSQIELNQGVDLIIFENYDIDKVCKMTSDELDRACNPEDDYSCCCEDYEDYCETFEIEEDLTGEVKALYEDEKVPCFKVLSRSFKNEEEVNILLPTDSIYIGKTNLENDIIKYYKDVDGKIYAIEKDYTNHTFTAMMVA